MKTTFIALLLCSLPLFAADPFDLERQGTELRLAGNFEDALVIEQRLLREFDEPVGHIFALNTIVTHLTWDETSTEYDDDLVMHAAHVFSWAEQNPAHPLSEYYAGQAHFAVSFHQALKGNYYRAGRHGTLGIETLETALERNPGLIDAKMHLGIAYFVADNLPPFIRMFSHLLWFIPSGNSEKSLPYLRDVMENGRKYADVARYIYSTLLLEDPELRQEAENQLRYLVDKYPTNSRFQLRLISLLIMQEKYADTLEVAGRYLAQDPPPEEPDLSLARIWMVRAHMGLHDIDNAQALFDQVDPVFDQNEGTLPGWSLAWHKLTEGQLSDLANQRDKARTIYREVLRIARATYVNNVIQEAAKAGLDRPYRLPAKQ